VSNVSQADHERGLARAIAFSGLCFAFSVVVLVVGWLHVNWFFPTIGLLILAEGAWRFFR
jgi:hypothetical protein